MRRLQALVVGVIALAVCTWTFADEIEDALDFEEAVVLTETKATHPKHNERIAKVFGLSTILHTDSVSFARTVHGQLGLTEEQFESLKQIDTRDPLQLIVSIGFRDALSNSASFYELPEAEFATSLKKLAEATVKQQELESKKLDELLSRRQRSRLQQIQFQQLINSNPLRALRVAGIESDARQRQIIIDFVNQPHNDRLLHQSQLLTKIREVFGSDAKVVDQLMGDFGSLDGSKRSAVSMILFFWWKA